MTTDECWLSNTAVTEAAVDGGQGGGAWEAALSMERGRICSRRKKLLEFEQGVAEFVL